MRAGVGPRVMKVSEKLETPIGAVVFTLATELMDGDDAAHRCALQLVQFAPQLPSKVSVETCYAVVATAGSASSLLKVTFEAILNPTSPLEMSPSTGEGLDAMEFVGPNHVLQLGTEDREFLEARLKGAARVGGSGDGLLENGLRIQLDNVRPNSLASLHILVAWNPTTNPEPLSCWFAVEQDHDAVLSKVNVR